MYSSYSSDAVIFASHGSPSPSRPSTAMRQLKAFLNRPDISDAAIIRHCLGRENLPGAPSLAENMIVIAFDVESWIHDTILLTEIGFCIFDSREKRKIELAGPHGENLLESMYWYHVRIQGHAHLINPTGDPETNRFGTTRFLTIPEARNMLIECFSRAISDERPELGNCPVVVLGHTLPTDLPKFLPAVGFDYLKVGTVVKQIGTQNMARSTGYWPGQPVGLDRLVKDILGFEYRDQHTTCNHISMTVIAAVQMVLPDELKVGQSKSLQDVVDHTEKVSKKIEWSHGSVTYCLRCNKRGNFKNQCRCGAQSRVAEVPFGYNGNVQTDG
ncbi:hypothetical protein EKO04_004467 [Ascochyta lentis]|uniref:Gfd2/YDR514C-like C-terminal domain-containing protein n=1 Tax=Ascochyta lentis TaxID=205686 RepID=A0A8H7J7N9_9PLEO|nr:hypothetical protein EKO04_004467 [Ascochyta lentis]